MDRPTEPYLPRYTSLLALLLIALLWPGWAGADEGPGASGEDLHWQVSDRTAGRRGGELTVAITSEPRTFLPPVAYDTATRAVVERLHATLVRMDGETFELQPALAESWTLSPDRTRLNLNLRRGVRFSDGEPFDADDVLFSLTAVQDPDLGAANYSFLVIDGQPVEVRKLGELRVELKLPFSHPTPLLLLSGIAMLPEHLLADSHRDGELAGAWPVGTEPAKLAGLGPFRLVHHEPGSHLELERNPNYWRRDAQGTTLPYLDRLVFRFVADETAKLLRFRSGDSHLMERIPGDAFAGLKAREAAGQPLIVRDLGPGLGSVFLVFNLNETDQPEVRKRQSWFRSSGFRRAVSLAMDRPAIARLVFHGRATPLVSDVSPGNRVFYDPALEGMGLALRGPELEAARAELRGAGFRQGEDGVWLDSDGARVSFTLVTNTSNSKRSAIATIVQDDLRRLGLDVTFVGLEFGALVERLTHSFDFDLLLLEFGGGVPDPSSTLNVWRVDGDSHYFRLGAETAAFDWEKRIDELMQTQARSVEPAERLRMIHEMQRLVAREVPFVYLVAPNVLVGAARELGNFAPSILEHPTLWNADELYWRPPVSEEPGGEN